VVGHKWKLRKRPQVPLNHKVQGNKKQRKIPLKTLNFLETVYVGIYSQDLHVKLGIWCIHQKFCYRVYGCN
jgi:hypothetical protein